MDYYLWPTKVPKQRLTWATGTDAYANPGEGDTATVLPGPCQIRIKRCDTFGALISLDGGTTDLLEAFANWSDDVWYAFSGGVSIQAKNENAGDDFTNLVIEVAE